MSTYLDELVKVNQERNDPPTPLFKNLVNVHEKVFTTIAPNDGNDDWKRQLIRDVPYARVFTEWGREELWDSSETMLGMPKELAKEHIKAGLFYFGGALFKMGAKALPFVGKSSAKFIANHRTVSEALSMFGAGISYGLVDTEADESALKTAGQWAVMPIAGRALSPLGTWAIGQAKIPAWKVAGAVGRLIPGGRKAGIKEFVERTLIPNISRIEKIDPEAARAFRKFQTDLHLTHEELYGIFKPIADTFDERMQEPFFMMMTKNYTKPMMKELQTRYSIDDKTFKLMRIGAGRMRKQYFTAGKQAVKRGLLDLQKFKSTMRTYFPAMTAEDDFLWGEFLKKTNNLNAKSTSKQARAAMTHFMFSKMQQMTPEERIDYGQIMDMSFVGFKSLNTIKKDIYFYDLTKSIAENAKFVIPMNVVKEAKKKIVGHEFRTLPKRFLKKFDLDGTLWDDVAMRPEFRTYILNAEKNGVFTTSAQVKHFLERQRARHSIGKTSNRFIFTDQQGIIPDEIVEYAGKGFKRMPRGKAYMNLSGRYVHPLVRRELTEMVSHLDDGFVKDLYMPVLHQWKAFKTIWSPAMHVRNPISNMFLNHMGGLPFWRGDVYARAIKEMEFKRLGRVGSKFFDEAAAHGLFKESMVLGELGTLTKDISLSSKKGWMQYIKRRFSKSEKFLGRAFEKEEHIAKFAKYIWNRTEGGMKSANPLKDKELMLKAANDAMKWTFNYSELPQAIKGARNIIPFITFPYKATAITAETLVNAPWRIHSIVYPFLGFAHANIGAANMTEKDFDELYLKLPEYMQKGRFALLPWKDKQGRMQWLDFGYMLPWGDLANGDGVLQLDAYAKQNPFVAISEDFRRNRDWLDRPIWNSWDEPSVKAYKMTEHMWNSVLPSFAGRDIKNLTKTIAGEEKARTPAQLAAATLAGTKITPRSKHQINVDAAKRRMAKRGELRRWFRKEMQKPLKPKERMETQEDYRKALRDILQRG